MKRIALEDTFIFILIKWLQWSLNLIPLPWAIRVAGCLGSLSGRFLKRRNIAYRNLRACFAHEKSPQELRAIVRESYQNFAMTIAEFLCSHKMNDSYLRQNVEMQSKEAEYKVRQYCDDGQSVFFLTSHFGNWELLNLYAGYRGYPMAVIVRDQKHPKVNGLLNSIRTSRGAKIIRRGMNLRRMMKASKEGVVVGILADQDGGKEGVFVRFFGKQTSCAPGVARFATRCDGKIFPVHSLRGHDGKHKIVFGNEISVNTSMSDEEIEFHVMSAFCKDAEKLISKYPGQWLWQHRRWKTSPNRVCLILDDGRKGHRHQSMALYQSLVQERRKRGLNDDLTTLKQIRIEYKSQWHRSVLTFWGMLLRGKSPLRWSLMKWGLTASTVKALRSSFADIVISCGSGTELINLMMADENSAKSCYIHKPQFGAKKFSVILQPQHDSAKRDKVKEEKRGPVILSTMGALNAFNQEHMASERDKFFKEEHLFQEKSKVIGVLIGGPSTIASWDKALVSQFIKEIKAEIKESNHVLMVSSSRRTDELTEQELKMAYGDWKSCKNLVIANESNPQGAYQRILSVSDMLIVTADSVSMLSEAMSTGKPVIALYPCQPDGMGAKMIRFMRDLEENHLVRSSTLALLRKNMEKILSKPIKHRSLKSNDLNQKALSEAAELLLK